MSDYFDIPWDDIDKEYNFRISVNTVNVYSKHDIEMNFVIIDQYGNYVSSFEGNTVKTTRKIHNAFMFWYESSAYEMALELQAVTGKWFGVEEL